MVSVAVASYNRQSLLAETISYLLKQTIPIELVVVDQTLAADDRLVSRARLEGWTYIHHPHPNLPAARNVAFASTTQPIVLWCDDDIVVQPDCLTHLVTHFEDPSVGGVGGTCVDEFGGEASASAPLVSWLPGYFMAYRRTAVIRAGGFDSFYSGSAVCEDVDFSVRVRGLGLKLIQANDARLIHLATVQGGCAVRAGRTEKQELEAFRFGVYCRLKLRPIEGDWLTLRLVWHLYRQFLLSREVLRTGKFLPRLKQAWRETSQLLAARPQVRYPSN